MSPSERFFVLAQHVLPQHALSRLAGRLARCRQPWLKDALIRAFARHYRIALDEAEHPDPSAYACFDDFFTRPLKAGVRPVDATPRVVVAPADGFLSQFGAIDDGCLLQAKGRHYRVEALLGGDPARAAPFQGGAFATIYLSPRDYHRLHMPLAGELREMVHVPGRLFSVNDATARGVPGLFARNERVAALFETEAGPMALVLVGALIVASIETVWYGVVTPPSGSTVRAWPYAAGAVSLGHGAEMGRFHLGSTIIVLFGPGAVTWRPELRPGAVIRMGQAIGRRGVG